MGIKFIKVVKEIRYIRDLLSRRGPHPPPPARVSMSNDGRGD